ncbi:MAG: haloacid dehalogenase-like hydrolase [Anaerolineales bacterium]|jgi:phosphoserine phosphatase
MIVVSDLMGTLTTGSPVLGLVDWVRHNQSKWQANWYMLSMLPGYFLAKRGLINWQRWGQGLMVNSLSMIRDATPQKFDEVAAWIVEADLWKKRRDNVIQRLNDHARDGAQVYIASSVHEPGVSAFARRIGAQAIGTPVEFVNGRVRIVGGLVADDRKLEQVLTRLGGDRVDFAYGDTALDVPLLEHAEHPVAVYPDEKLRAAAKERGWEIMGETASYP